MKVLFASRAYESKKQEGGFVLLIDIAEFISLNSKDIKTSFFSTNKINNQGFEIELVPIFSNTGWGKWRGLEFFIGLFLNQYRFEIIHTAHVPTLGNSTLFRFLKFFGKFAGIRYLQTITSLPEVSNKKLKYLCWGDAINCLSNEAEKRLTKININTVTMLPWPSPNRIRFNSDRRKVTRSQFFSNFDKIILYPGEFSKLGIGSDFSDCISETLSLDESICFVLACRFDIQGIGKEIVSKLPKSLRRQVILLGESNQIIELIEASDLVIFPALKMTGKFQPPLVLMESLALGVPILTSDIIDIGIDLDEDVFRQVLFTNWRDFGNEVKLSLASSKSPGFQRKNLFEDMALKYMNIYSGMAN
jgi:glycosyltransferase involved in cell wall biosynthesis